MNGPRDRFSREDPFSSIDFCVTCSAYKLSAKIEVWFWCFARILSFATRDQRPLDHLNESRAPS